MTRPLAVSVSSASGARGDVVLVGVLEGVATPLPPKLAEAMGRVRFHGREDERVDVPLDARRRLVLHGLGASAELDLARLRSWLRRAVRGAATADARRLVLHLPDHDETRGEQAARRIGLEVALARYRFDDYRAESPPGRLDRVQLVPPDGQEEAYRRGLRGLEPLAEAVSRARDLGNTPPNVASPAWIATQARRLGRTHGLSVQVLAEAELRRRGMGGILAVGSGSAQKPRLVRLSWGQRGPKVALVGKGVTFDTGGISIKPAASMEEMKYDKCGACTVLAVAMLAAARKLEVRLTAYLPLAENMPSAAAYRPGDIVRCHNGTTVEIHNTDAEGRLILADAISLACQSRPDFLVELSTLTGAAVVALGETGAALYSPDDDLVAALLGAAGASGERLWRMPLWPEFAAEMKGNHADLKNSAGRWGGANTAAAFLANFVAPGVRWAHLDIAGPAYGKHDGEGQSATGYGVALLANWLEGL